MKNRWVFLITAVLLLPCSLGFAADRRGIDCGCSEVGVYSGLTKIAAPALIEHYNIEEETYTHGNYSVAIGTQPAPTGASVAINITKGGSTCASFSSIVLQAGWGFSPDGNRFVVHCKGTNGSYHIRLYDLQKPSGSSPYEIFDSVDVSSAALGFSPSGRYFACAVKTTQALYLGVFDVLDPTSRKTEVSSMTAISHAGWGFSPENLADDDAAFFWAMQTNLGITCRLVNLQTMAQYEVGAADGTWWGFSPCGDIFATVNGPDKSVILYHTGTGEQIAAGGWTGMASNLKPRCDAGSHYIGDTVLIENTADKDCEGGEDTQAPTWPDGAELVATDIYPVSVELAWTPAEDNVAVTQYRIFQDDELVNTVDAERLDYSVTGLSSATQYTFRIEAGDAADNWSDDGPSLTVTTTDRAPTWPDDADLDVDNITETTLTLTWTEATDDKGVSGYRIYQASWPEGILLAEVAASIFQLDVTGLEPWTEYTFYVEAGDDSDNWSKGPSVWIQTLDEHAPTWPLPKSLTTSQLGSTYMSLTWSDAQDNVIVQDYLLYVYRNEEWDLVDVGNKPMMLSCLSPQTSFTLKVEAVDPAGNISTDGPVATLTTGSGGTGCSSSLERVSVSSSGQQTYGAPSPDGWAPHDSEYPSISDDGRFVAFKSIAVNLVPNDDNSIRVIYYGENSWSAYWNGDIFVRDRLPGTTERVSLSGSGEEGDIDGSSSNPVISADGRYVVFDSTCSNLVGGDTNESRDIFLHDRQDHSTIRVSLTSSGEQADGHSGGWYHKPAVSNDGRFVAFVSKATNLVPDDTNGKSDIFVKDLQTGNVRRVSVSSSGEQGNRDSWGTAISADGRYVAFVSLAGNLIENDTNYGADVFVHDCVTGQTSLVSLSSQGTQASGHCSCLNSTREIDRWPARMSDDGRYVTFDSEASNLTVDDTNSKRDVFVHDRLTGVTRRVSIAADGTEADKDSRKPDISGNGRFVVFESRATTLIPEYDDGWITDVYIHDTALQTTKKLSRCPCAQHGDDESYHATVNADGTVTAFDSHAPNLLPNLEDTNRDGDVFVLEQEVAPAADLSLSLSSVPVPGRVNARMICTARIQNLGSDDATGIVMTETIPMDVTISDVSAPAGSLEIIENSVQYTLDLLERNQKIDVTTEIIPSEEETIIITATVICDLPEMVVENNTATLESTILDVSSPDYDGEEGIDLSDFSVMALDWMNTNAPFADIAPDGGDGIVNFKDLLVFAGYWLNNE